MVPSGIYAKLHAAQSKPVGGRGMQTNKQKTDRQTSVLSYLNDIDSKKRILDIKYLYLGAHTHTHTPKPSHEHKLK